MSNRQVKLDDSELEMLRYFWEEKGDLERYTGWQDLQADLAANYPEILEAWRQYTTSYAMLTAVLRGVEVKR